jgi:hypothetical protein
MGHPRKEGQMVGLSSMEDGTMEEIKSVTLSKQEGRELCWLLLLLFFFSYPLVSEKHILRFSSGSKLS